MNIKNKIISKLRKMYCNFAKKLIPIVTDNRQSLKDYWEMVEENKGWLLENEKLKEENKKLKANLDKCITKK